MGDLAHESSPRSTNGASSESSASVSEVATGEVATGEVATDVIYVCRSVTLRRAEYRFYRAILLTFPAHGGPPDRATLRQLARGFGLHLEVTLALLAAQDLVQRDPATGAITAAYPFSGVPTAHRVHLAATPDYPAVELFAMCALDALGIPLLLQRAATITSEDRLTREPVRVSVVSAVRGASTSASASASTSASASASASAGAEDGEWSAAWDPAETVVVARPEDHEHEHGVGAAEACCPIINFFRSAHHAERWVAAHPDSAVRVYSQAQALRHAATLFAGVLDRLAADERPIP
ncbi:MAG: organomercurial lyase [Ktedonobacterales bacterium]